MKLIARCVAVFLIFGMAFWMPSKAQADEGFPPMRFGTTLICIQTDFPALKSGWQIKNAIEVLNASQPTLHFQFHWEEGCSILRFHQYSADDGEGGHTEWANDPVGDVWWVYRSADVYLNLFYPRYSKCFSRYLVNHEIMHAVGFPIHTTPSSTSLLSYAYRSEKLCGLPSQYDIDLLANRYADS